MALFEGVADVVTTAHVDSLTELIERSGWGYHILGYLGLLASLAASVHVILRKRDSRSAIGWIGLIWLSPFVGAFLYAVLGVNRIRRRAKAIRPRPLGYSARETLGENISVDSAGLLRLGDSVTGVRASGGCSVEVYYNGEEAYPAMLKAIDSARYSITLATYIFDVDVVGNRFADALVAAKDRGVQVRVLIDDVGARYSWKRMHRRLRKRGIRVARFLPVYSFRSFMFINLRLHRKIVVVDGMTAFTGGMNIRSAHEVMRGLPGSVRDTHFRVRGPVVADIQRVFANDWEFTTRETLKGENWFPPLSEEGSVLARCVDDGPDQHFENARWILLGAISNSKSHIRIATPYFVPDAGLITALNTAALRGVRVQIVLPENNNLPWVHWACMGTIRQVLERGCEIYLTPGAFDHSKLMTVDDRWTFFGSMNWDARSLRLNFEMNVEGFDTALAHKVGSHIDLLVSKAHRFTLEDLGRRSFWVRLRDGTARLFSPYL